MSDNLVYNFQLFSISASVAVTIYFFCKAICGTKHGVKGVLLMTLHWLYRFFFQEIFYSFYLERIYGKESWFTTVYAFLHFIEVIIFMVVMSYVFRGSLVKILLFSFLVECVATVLMMMTQTLLVGGIDFGSTHGNPGKYMLRILGGVLLAVLIYWSIYRLLRSHLVRLQTYEVKHTRVIGTLILLEYLVSFITNSRQEVLHQMKFAQFMEVFGLNVLVIFAVLLGYTFVIYTKRKKQRTLLEKQVETLQGWHEVISEQEEILYSQQFAIREALTSMGEMQSASQKNVALSQYIDHIRSQYDKIQAGVYSADRKLDAFLLALNKQCKSLGIGTEIFFQGYKGGCFDEQSVEELLWILFENLCQNSSDTADRHMILRATDQGQYTLILLKMKGILCTEKEWKRLVKKCQRQVNIILKSHHGIMTMDKKEDGFEIKVMAGGE